MAVTETRSLVNPTLEGSLTAFLKKLDPLGGQQINTAAYAPQVAEEIHYKQHLKQPQLV